MNQMQLAIITGYAYSEYIYPKGRITAGDVDLTNTAVAKEVSFLSNEGYLAVNSCGREEQSGPFRMFVPTQKAWDYLIRICPPGNNEFNAMSTGSWEKLSEKHMNAKDLPKDPQVVAKNENEKTDSTSTTIRTYGNWRYNGSTDPSERKLYSGLEPILDLIPSDLWPHIKVLRIPKFDIYVDRYDPKTETYVLSVYRNK